MEHERILQILDYLETHTDENRFVTLRDIKAYLEGSCGYNNISILTLRRDMDRMEAAGKPLHIKSGAHNTICYSLRKKGFTFNEIRFLVDSVSINKFLSNSQKQRLIKKFESVCSEDEVRRLISRIQLSDVAPENLDLLDNLAKIHTLISEKRKIDFEYGKYDINRHIEYYSKRRSMIPCKVIYFDERFYLKCINEEDGKLRTYRIDRMRCIRGGEHTRMKTDLPKADGVVLDMFEPEYYTSVQLKVRRFLLDDMLERFGNYASVRSISEDPENVLVNVRIGIGKTFYEWLLRYGENLELISPEPLRSGMAEYLKKISDMYEK